MKLKWLFVLFCPLLVFVPYRNPHFWSDLHWTLHSSPPSSAGGRRVCMDPQYSTFPTFLASFVGSGWRILRGRWLPARYFSHTLISMIPGRVHDVALADHNCEFLLGASCTVGDAYKTRGSERNTYMCVCVCACVHARVCVWERERNGNLMRRAGSEQWIAIALRLCKR